MVCLIDSFVPWCELCIPLGMSYLTIVWILMPELGAKIARAADVATSLAVELTGSFQARVHYSFP
jgi:hypothetical protein